MHAVNDSSDFMVHHLFTLRLPTSCARRHLGTSERLAEIPSR
jgi:hypothetical protein